MNKGLWRCRVFSRGNGGEEAKPPSPKLGDIKRRAASKKPVATIYSTKKCLPDDRSESETIA